jgi:RNA polymerase sigma-70 factor (ECF subfamily)
VSDLPPDDTRLVAAARQGDRDAFGILVERHQDRIFNSLLRVLGSRDDALDVVQDAMVQAFVKLDSFRGDAKFSTWLYRIAMNLALSYRRRHRPSVSVEELKQRVGEEPVSELPAPDKNLMDQERAATVQQALAALEVQHCQILVLREMENCAYADIAQILELPVGTVRSRLFRARMQLKEKLIELLPNEVDQV